jgi:hypothetical protein
MSEVANAGGVVGVVGRGEGVAGEGEGSNRALAWRRAMDTERFFVFSTWAKLLAPKAKV